MKVLHIVQYLAPGGLENFVFELCKSQIEEGVTVDVLFYDNLDTWVEKFEKAGIKVHRFRKKTNGFDILISKEISKIKTNYDIIHTHDISPLFYLCFSKLFSIFCLDQIVHTIHGLSQIENNKKYQFYEFILLFFCQKIIFVGSKTMSFYLQKFKMYEEKYQLIVNGIKRKKISQINRKELWNNFNIQDIDNKVLFVQIARIVPLKNQLRLIKDFDLDDGILILVGPVGDIEYQEEIQNAIRSRKNIYWIGSQDNIEEILLASDYFISFSQTEGLPISVLEAMALNRPCILSLIDGHNQFKGAYFYNLLENHSLNQYLEEFVTKEMDQYITKMAMEQINEEFSFERCTQAYLNVYSLLRR